MSEHTITVEYTTDDDGIWLGCTCGERIGAGCSPTVAALTELANGHVRALQGHLSR